MRPSKRVLSHVHVTYHIMLFYPISLRQYLIVQMAMTNLNMNTHAQEVNRECYSLVRFDMDRDLHERLRRQWMTENSQ